MVQRSSSFSPIRLFDGYPTVEVEGLLLKLTDSNSQLTNERPTFDLEEIYEFF